jgi:hypothetical protein
LNISRISFTITIQIFYFMEELQSTEMLDREILEDARKKVLRILKTADDTVQAQTAEWEKKTSASLDDLEKKYAEQCASACEEIMVRMPIDKRRAKAEKIKNLLLSAVESWYAGLSRAQVMELLKRELVKRLALVEEFKTVGQRRAIVSGLDHQEAESLLQVVNGTCVIEEVSAAHHYPSITVETGYVRVTASIQKTADFLLQEKRLELVEALLSRAFMGDEA